MNLGCMLTLVPTMLSHYGTFVLTALNYKIPVGLISIDVIQQMHEI